MKITRKYDDTKSIRDAAQRLADAGELSGTFAPETVRCYNQTLSSKKSIFFGFLLHFRKYGWVVPFMWFLLSFLFPILGFNLRQAMSLPFFAFLIEIIFPVLTVIWVIIWFAYWLTPLKHCDYCNRMFTRKILYEKYVPNSTREGVETRIAKRNIKSNSGKVIGSYDESYSVDIETKKYYTVFGCKKCNHAKIEIIEKQFDV